MPSLPYPDVFWIGERRRSPPAGSRGFSQVLGSYDPAVRFRVEPAVTQPAPPQIRT